MKLLIDAGNSRIKWGLHDGRAWLQSGAVGQAEIPGLRQVWQELPPPRAIVIANVAGKNIRAALDSCLSVFNSVQTCWIESRAQQCGVRNAYAEPAQLGVDRWAAAIAAWHLTRAACVIVNAGTAVTVDALSGAGMFLGGLIMPGSQLMRGALARHTALEFPRGKVKTFPANTADAIESGIIAALCGAVQCMRAALGGDAQCLLSGGAAAELAAHLNPAPRLVDNLVLEGLVHIARELYHL
ncbi:MAG: type III pantothenate kinase [Burkholderiales bacterium]